LALRDALQFAAHFWFQPTPHSVGLAEIPLNIDFSGFKAFLHVPSAQTSPLCLLTMSPKFGDQRSKTSVIRTPTKNGFLPTSLVNLGRFQLLVQLGNRWFSWAVLAGHQPHRGQIL
jgi:hypothetical protein